MAKTLQNILIDSAGYLDLDAQLPTGDELTTRANYADRAVREAAASGNLKEFSRVWRTFITTSTISMPADFRETEGALYVLDSSGQWNDFPIIDPREFQKYSVTEQFGYITGNRAAGHTLTINNMGSYTTISMVYQAYPSGLLTLADVCELADETFVTRKVEAYVLESRSDNRFQVVDADANRKLSNMVGRSNKRPAGPGNRTARNFRNPLS